jgi:molybdate transport system ATP-binding protein
MIEFDFSTRAGGFALRARAQARTPGIIGVFGPSGAGKTTLLRAIAGLAPIEGSITLDGERLSAPPETRRIAYVFQDSRLFPHLSVRENLRYGLKRAPAPHKLDFTEIVAALDIEALLDRDPQNLSGGEQKRVALGRALLSQPRLILMDEPMAGVDDARKAEILRLIAGARSRFGVSILLVSHDLDEVAALADDLMLIDNGAVTRCGAAAAVFADPGGPLSERSDARVLIDGVVTQSDAAHGVTHISAGEGELTLPWMDAPLRSRVRAQIFARDVTLAVKAPEAISTQNVLAGTISALRIRKDRLALVAIATKAGPVLSTITQQSAERLHLQPGASVFALVKATSFVAR